MTMMEAPMSAIDKSWEESALCRGMPLEMFDDYGYNVTAAKRTCILCPVRTICLAQNLDESWGIWGGLNLPERRGYKEGLPIQFCDTCGSTFTRTKGDQCMHCQTKPLAPALLRDQVELVSDLASNGRTDTQIAAHLRELLSNQDIDASHVRSVRRRNGITAGARTKSNNARAIARKIAKNLNTYSERTVSMAQTTETKLGALTQLERLELLRRWFAKGGTRTTFARHFHCSGLKVNELVSELAEADRQGDVP